MQVTVSCWTKGEYVLRLKGGSEYTVTRTYKKNLQLLAQSWILENSSPVLVYSDKLPGQS
jgi:hypothetical protein